MTYASSTSVLARRRRLGTVLIAIAGILFALWATMFAPLPSQAAEGDPFRVSGNVQLDGAPLEGVGIMVDGPGGQQTTETDADGKWSVAVPERNAAAARPQRTAARTGHRPPDWPAASAASRSARAAARCSMVSRESGW